MLYYITSAVARAHPTVAVAEAGQDSKAEPYVNLAQYLLQEREFTYLYIGQARKIKEQLGDAALAVPRVAYGN